VTDCLILFIRSHAYRGQWGLRVLKRSSLESVTFFTPGKCKSGSHRS